MELDMVHVILGCLCVIVVSCGIHVVATLVVNKITQLETYYNDMIARIAKLEADIKSVPKL